MPPREEFTGLDEYNLENLIITDRLSGAQQPFLLPPSSANPRGGPGYCLCLACSDAFNHRRRLHEFTRPPSTAEFFSQIYSYSYSVDQLILAKTKHIGDTMQYVCDKGVANAKHYSAAPLIQPLIPGSTEKELTGCPRLSIDGYKRFSRNWILPESEKQQELDRWKGEIVNEMKNFGPLVGCFSCQRDVSKIATEFLYDPSPSTPLINLSHAVMLIGDGLAYHEPTHKWKSYAIILNNWGSCGNPIGRIPWEKIVDVYAPTFKDQVSLVKYMNDQDAEANWRYELKIDQQVEYPMEF